MANTPPPANEAQTAPVCAPQAPRIGQVFNDFTMPGGEAAVARKMADLLGAVTFERSSREWADAGALEKAGFFFKSFANWEVLRAFREWLDRERPDALIFHNIFPVLSPAVVEEASRRRIATIVYLHSYRYLCANGFFLNHGRPCERCIGGNFWPAALTACWRDSRLLSAWYGSVLATLRPRGFFERVDRFVSVSEFVRSKYIEAGIPPGRIVALHNCFPYRDYFPVAEDEGYVLFMGRFSAEKGVLTLLKAARDLPGIPFQLAGDGPQMEEARRYIGEHGLRNVTLAGFVEAKARQKLYAGARFVVVPSEWFEPFATVVPEAYSNGKPVLASRMGGLIEMIEPGKTGELFDRANVTQLANLIRAMFEDRTRTAAWGRNARVWVETHCDPDLWKQKIMGIISETLQNRAS